MTRAELVALQLRELLSFGDLQQRTGRAEDVKLLRISCAVARELARMGYGADEVPRVERAAAVLHAIKVPPADCLGFSTAGEAEAVRWLLSFHDAQRAAVQRRDYLCALAAVRS